MPDILKLIISIAVCQLAGGTGSIFTRKNIPGWYANLNKPSFNPPNKVFGPVWITLYILMGIAFFLIWKNGMNSPDFQTSVYIFAAQLVFNTLWSVVFFGMRSLTGGMVVIIILWLLILGSIIFFLKISTIAGLLLIPYILWVSFASVLNYSIIKLN